MRETAPSADAPARRVRNTAARVALVAFATALFAAPALAHGGPGIASAPVSTPTWLFLLTGGGVIAISFLLTSFVTDRATLEGYHERRLGLPGGTALRRAGSILGVAVGLLGLAAVIGVGLFGPDEGGRNLAVLLVWVFWWAGFTISVYLVGNSWPAFDPFRHLAAAVPETGRYDLPASVGSWPSVAGLLLLVWVEVVSDVASDPIQLAGVVIAYAVATVAGVAAFGRDTWVSQVDPIAHVFRIYGRVAPVQRTDDGLELVIPGAALAAERVKADGGVETGVSSEVGFIVALLWVTSFDGFVATPLWRDILVPIASVGVPPRLVYFAAMLLGYAVFLGAYWGASKYARKTGDTYLSASSIAIAFAPALVPIAAGYHFAHYLPYFLRLLPSVVLAATAPLAPPELQILSMPGWVGGIGPTAVLLGHVLAVWVAHSRSFDLFTGKLQPIRSQYPFVIVMVVYTMSSLWLLAQPVIQIQL